MRILVVGPAEREELKALAEFANLPENEYRPGPDVPQPGSDPRHVRTLGTLRVVFSITSDGTDRFKHLSVSVVDGTGRLPHPAMVEEVARGLGFTGEMVEDWEMMASGRHVVVGQRI